MEKSKTKHNIIEKVIFGVGVIVLLALCGYLILEIIRQSKSEDKAPRIEVSTSHKPNMDAYTFEVEVENSGNESAEDVHLQMQLYQNGEAAETGTVTFKYVPLKSKRSAFIVFSKNRSSSDSLVVITKTFNRP